MKPNLEEPLKRRYEDMFPADHTLHHEYLAQVLEREARRTVFQRAVIEKTFVALLWSGITSAGIVAVNFFKDHWK